MSTTFIYALKDPRDGRVRYVGKADDPEHRLRRHVATRKENSARGRWISSLFDAGKRPLLIVLEEVSLSAWKDGERKWIARFREESQLVNTMDGGNGGDGLLPSVPVVPHNVVDRLVEFFCSVDGRIELAHIGCISRLRGGKLTTRDADQERHRQVASSRLRPLRQG